jgi:nitrite reductase (NADH) small subunit
MTMLDDPTEAAERSVGTWHQVCPASRLNPDRGVSALIDGRAVAVFRLAGGALHAVSGTDPFSGATIMSRGLVGSIGGRPVVVSPMFKQRFDLESGVCLDDPSVSLAVFAVRLADDTVEVSIA